MKDKCVDCGNDFELKDLTVELREDSFWICRQCYLKSMELKSNRSLYLYYPGIEKFDYRPRNIIIDVCDYFRMDPSKINYKTRRREILIPRQVATYFIHEKFPELTLKNIKDYFNQDHATILNSIKIIRNLRDTDKVFKKIITDLDGIISESLAKSSKQIVAKVK